MPTNLSRSANGRETTHNDAAMRGENNGNNGKQQNEPSKPPTECLRPQDEERLVLQGRLISRESIRNGRWDPSQARARRSEIQYWLPYPAREDGNRCQPRKQNPVGPPTYKICMRRCKMWLPASETAIPWRKILGWTAPAR